MILTYWACLPIPNQDLPVDRAVGLTSPGSLTTLSQLPELFQLPSSSEAELSLLWTWDTGIAKGGTGGTCPQDSHISVVTAGLKQSEARAQNACYFGVLGLTHLRKTLFRSMILVYNLFIGRLSTITCPYPVEQGHEVGYRWIYEQVSICFYVM